MTLTDIGVIAGFIFLIVKAARSGFLHTIFWPMATLISSLVSAGSYFLSNNLWVTGAIVLGTGLAIKTVRPWFQREFETNDPVPLCCADRISAVIVNIFWGALLAFVIVLALSLLPFEKMGYADVTRDVLRSKTYQKIASIMAVSPRQEAAPCPTCDNNLNTLAGSSMVQELLQDPRITKLINDPEFQNALQTKDMSKIAQHPILKELRTDPDFLIKALRIHMTMRASETN